MAVEKLIRDDPGRAALEDCIKTIDEINSQLDKKMEAALVKELREWEKRRLELEQQYSKDTADTFFPPGMSKHDILEKLQEMTIRAMSLPN